MRTDILSNLTILLPVLPKYASKILTAKSIAYYCSKSKSSLTSLFRSPVDIPGSGKGNVILTESVRKVGKQPRDILTTPQMRQSNVGSLFRIVSDLTGLVGRDIF